MFNALDHTFVVCAYKENPFIEEAINSLENQQVLGSIVLSTSTPSRYLEDLCAKHKIEMIVNKYPHLAGDDWNYGYNYAKTPLVTIAHQDDYYEPTYLSSFLRRINEYDPSEVSLLFSDYYELRNGKSVRDNRLLKIKRIMNRPLASSWLNGSSFIKQRILSFGNPICCPSVMLVKSVLGESVFDTSYTNSCDYKTWVNLARKRGRFVYVREKLMGHRIYGESSTSINLGEDIRSGEDFEILNSLWPSIIAQGINALYVKSEKSNQV